jgi:hypothetical protein
MRQPPTDSKGAAETIVVRHAAAESAYAVPERVRALLGPSWLIEGEDPKLYEELLGRVAAAVQPIDMIDWLLLNDIVALTWEIQRSRRHRETIVRMGRLTAMAQVLDQAIPHEGDLFQTIRRIEDVGKFSSEWIRADGKATKRSLALLSKAGFSLSDVSAQSLTVKADELDRVDQQVQRHETRRDAVLQQIERRRQGFAQQVRRASEEAVDAQFVEASPTAVALPTNAEKVGEA